MVKWSCALTVLVLSHNTQVSLLFILIVKGSDNGILCLGLLGFLIVSIISLLEKEHYISEVGYVSFARWVGQEAPTQMFDRQKCCQSLDGLYHLTTSTYVLGSSFVSGV